MRNTLMLLLFLTAAFSAGLIGAQFSPGPWYANLAKPDWTPPGWIFPPVWLLLYILIGFSGWLVWQSVGFAGAKMAMVFYGLQLVLNGIWSWLFFGRHLIGTALIEIVILWMAILATTVLFWTIRPASGLLLVPYLIWVGFATALNWAIWRLNA